MTTVIYHSADYDGIFCREIAKKFLGDQDVQYIGWNFGDPLIPFPKDGTVYILDLSPDCLSAQVPNPPNTDNKSRMIWIDHHKTSIEKYAEDIPGYRIDGVAACRLAWQWFSEAQIAKKTGEAMRLPEKHHFIERNVSEPITVRLIGEYDIWDKRDSRADILQFALRCTELSEIDWSMLLSYNGVVKLERLLQDGTVAQRYGKHVDASIVNTRSFMLEWEGLKWLAMNSIRCNSLSFEAKDSPETGHDALLAFFFNGKCWTVSLYHAQHRTDLDLSEIAKKYGGGGHRGACGFTCDFPPFLTQNKQ